MIAAWKEARRRRAFSGDCAPHEARIAGVPLARSSHFVEPCPHVARSREHEAPDPSPSSSAIAGAMAFFPKRTRDVACA